MAKEQQTVKNGRVPLAKKKTSMRKVHPDSPSLEPDITAISKELQEELDAKGLCHRWVNQKQYVENGGFHRSGWRAYRSEKKDSSGDIGTNADGYITRMGLILAVKTVEEQQAHRARLARKNRDMASVAKSKADDFKKVARQAGATVDEGYEDEDGDDSGYKTVTRYQDDE